jgi:predicted nucleic acid-binding protein
LVKLVVEEDESSSLEHHLAGEPHLATSRLAVIEVLRATSLANPAPEVRIAADRLLASCLLVEVSADLVRSAASLTSTTLRTLDAIHLASALRVGPDEFIAYDRRLLDAASSHGLAVSSPGASA